MKKSVDLSRLITHARAETPPRVDVADDVLSLLAVRRPAVSYHPLMWIASLSSAAAACAAVISFVIMRASQSNALSNMYEVISWAAQ